MNDKKPAPHDEADVPSQLRLPVGATEEEVGARLRHQRLKRKISIEDAARALKLAPATLQEIERGDLGRYESIYQRGYLRNYARFLGLEPEPLVAMLQEADLPPLRTVLPLRSPGPNFERFLKIATYAIVTTLIIPPLVLIYIQGGLDFLDRDRSVVVESSETAVAGGGLVGQTPLPQRSAAAVAERDTISTGPVTASALPLTYIRPVRDPVAEDQLQQADLESLASSSEAPDPRSVLLVELLDDSWLEVYAADGRRLEFDLLRAGDQRRFVAEAPFRILAGRASAVNLILDGEVLRFEGQDRGDVVSLELSADGVILRN
jgi:cytoskeleton protein RodZ